MKECFCFNTDALLTHLPGFELRSIWTINESEDDCCAKAVFYLTNQANVIDSIHNYHSLWTSTKVKFKNGDSSNIHSNNANHCDKDLLRFTENNFLSPALKISADHIEASVDLVAWLKFNGLSEEIIASLTEKYTVYSVVEYPGVSTPIRHGKYWGYSNEPLKLDEREIDTVLTGIEDDLLRKKIECILYARVFKKHT